MIWLLMLVSCVFQDDSKHPPHIQLILKDVRSQIVDDKEAAEARIKEAQQELKDYARGRVDRRVKKHEVNDRGVHLFSSRDERKSLTASLEDEIESKKALLQLIEDNGYFPVHRMNSLDIGEVGTIVGFKVNQIIDGDIYADLEYFVKRNRLIGNTLQTYDDIAEKAIVIKGLDHSRLSSGQRVVPTEVFAITGTTTYETVVGSTKTVLIFEKVDANRIGEILKD